VTYFDATLEAPPIQEQNVDPILPEERHVFELIGFERSEPDRFRKEGGIKWTWLVYEEDGRTPFIFQDAQYTFFRTTGIDKQGRPVFSVGTYANDWASAMLGRQLGVDAHFEISELRGKRMSAMVVWKPQRDDPKKKSIQLASLRHVPTGTQAAAAPPSRAQVEANATVEDVDRALWLSKFEKKLERARKKKLHQSTLSVFENAWDSISGSTSVAEIEGLVDSLDAAIDAMDE
jgi:hypothetical protein